MGQRDADAGDGQRADHHRPEGQRDLLPQTAIVAHILFVVRRMDDRTRAKEQHRLEEGMREQVEHRHRIDAHTRRHEHIAKLRHGRIGDDALDVVLHQTNGRRDEGRQRTDHHDHRGRVGRVFIKGRHPADQEHPGGDHGSGVDQRRHRRRALHRVRQPGVQDQLRRFPHRADEQQHPDQVRRVPVRPQEMQVGFRQRRGGSEDIVELDAVGQVIKPENPQRKAKVADAVDHEGLDRRRIGRRLAIIEADQQVRRDAHAFPAKEHLHQVVRRHQHQHGEGEERQIGKEAGLVMLALMPVVVMRHVTEGIKVDQG